MNTLYIFDIKYHNSESEAYCFPTIDFSLSFVLSCVFYSSYARLLLATGFYGFKYIIKAKLAIYQRL